MKIRVVSGLVKFSYQGPPFALTLKEFFCAEKVPDGYGGPHTLAFTTAMHISFPTWQCTTFSIGWRYRIVFPV